MILTEDYINEEQAKKLKDKGFPFPEATDLSFTNFPTGYLCVNPIDGVEYIIPTLSLVQKWLRKAKEITILIKTAWHQSYYEKNEKEVYYFYITDETFISDLKTKYYDSYEQALSAAIDKCLDLI